MSHSLILLIVWMQVITKTGSVNLCQTVFGFSCVCLSIISYFISSNFLKRPHLTKYWRGKNTLKNKFLWLILINFCLVGRSSGPHAVAPPDQSLSSWSLAQSRQPKGNLLHALVPPHFRCFCLHLMSLAAICLAPCKQSVHINLWAENEVSKNHPY